MLLGLNDFLIFFALITPLTFFWGNNYHKCRVSQIFLSYLLLISLAIATILFLSLLFSSSFIFSVNIRDCVYAFVAYSFMLICMEDFFSLLGMKALSKTLSLIILPIVAYFWGNIFLLCFILILFVGSVVDIAKCFSRGKLPVDCAQLPESMHKFSNTPNINFVLLESYHSQKAISEIYNFDNVELISYLERNNFSIVENAYANYSDTLSTMLALMTLRHHFYKHQAGNQDVLSAARDTFLGISHNPVFEILEKNGYKINFFDDGVYICGNELSPKIANSNLKMISRSNYLNYFYPLLHLSTRIEKSFFSRRQFFPGLENPIDAYLHFFDPNSKYPSFNFFHFGADHTESTDTWDNLPDWNDKYLHLLERANMEIVRLVDIIQKNDPNSLTILIGDHGACKYRNAFCGTSDPDENLQNAGFSIKEIAEDYFSVICAIRWVGRKVNLPSTISHVNLFYFLFSWLSSKPLDLSLLQEDNSYIWHDFKSPLQVIEKGNVLSSFK